MGSWGSIKRPPSLIAVDVQQVPAAAKSEMEAEIRRRESKIDEIEQQLTGLGVSRDSLKLLADYYRVRADKYEVLGTLPQSERTFFISGYVPVKYAECAGEQV